MPPTPAVTGAPASPVAATLPADAAPLPPPTLAGGAAQPTAEALVLQPPPPATATADSALHGRYTPVSYTHLTLPTSDLV